MKFYVAAVAASSLLLTSASAASAQVINDVIGAAVGNAIASGEHSACLSGARVLSEKEAREADGPTQELIAKYWAKASAADNASIGDLYPPFGPAAWVSGGAQKKARKAPITDPYARAAGNALVETPVAMVRGMAGHVARGVWEVRSASGGHVGYYLADFSRSPSWRLTRLELLPAGSAAPTIGAFCSAPGDVEAFHKEAAAIPEKKIAKIVKKATPLATCREGADCTDKWLLAKKWVEAKSLLPLIRNTDNLMLTVGTYYGSIDLSYALVLDPPSNGEQTLRFRAWCGNWIMCAPSPDAARKDFAAALGVTLAESR